MSDVIRLVCPECDAVHRVKSVTLGKLYRCKKCRSGLITMQPAILSCPNCGATTPPTHIEVSRLITCEECEKAPLMEVRIPGVKYPGKVNSKESEQIATKMFAAPESQEAGSDDNEEVIVSSQEVVEDAVAPVEQKIVESSEMDENSIFKSDTNFIIKEKKKKDGVQAESQKKEHAVSSIQLKVFDDYDQENESEVSETIVDTADNMQEQAVLPALPDVAEGDVVAEIAPSLEIDEDIAFEVEDYNESVLEREEERLEDDGSLEDSEVPSYQQRPSSVPIGRNREKWKVPAWMPAILVLLLMGLYGMMVADLEALKKQLAVSQNSIIKQNEAFQQERVKFMALLREARSEKRELERDIQDLKSENTALRKRNINFDGPEFKDN